MEELNGEMKEEGTEQKSLSVYGGLNWSCAAPGFLKIHILINETFWCLGGDAPFFKALLKD